MNHGSLFSGIGGFDLAAEWMGWENKFHCEWNPFGQRVLKYYWPNAISYNDITKTDFSIHRGTIDILTGGFPCQPYSSAGLRKGKEDERHLWPEMLRTIREVQPRYIIGENVRGITNWNGGVVFDEVQSDMEIEGYEVLPFLLPACSVNAPHRRDRIWFVAYRNGDGFSRNNISPVGQQHDGGWSTRSGIDSFNGSESSTNTNDERLQGSENERIFNRTEQNRTEQSPRLLRSKWEEFPTVAPICNGNDGLPKKLDGITVSKWRVESIKAGGNAIVPQVVFEIFKAIQQFDDANTPRE